MFSLSSDTQYRYIHSLFVWNCLPTKGIVAVCPIVMIDLTDTGKNKKKNLSQYQKEELAAITIELLIAVLQLIQPED